MEKKKTVLYIHGMGGGGDSRIPSILSEHVSDIVVRTYSFDPDEASQQIASWVRELQPVLIIGESLGSLQAIAVTGIPHILVSPSLNAAAVFGWLSFLALIPGVTPLLDRIYRPREGDRQPLHFSFHVLRKYRRLHRRFLANTPFHGSQDSFHAFFGTHDHYRRSGIVSVRTYRKLFGDTYTLYEGTHFMEEEHVLALLVPAIRKVVSQAGLQ